MFLVETLMEMAYNKIYAARNSAGRKTGGIKLDQQEKMEKRMVNRAYFACVAVIFAGCAVFALLVSLLLGYRFTADGAVRKEWREAETLQMGDFTIYYELSQGNDPYIQRFVAVEKAAFLYVRNGDSGKLVYPAGSDVPAGQMFSYQDGDRWHHVLLLDMVLPEGTDRQITKLVVREETVEVTLNSCFSTPRKFTEFVLDGVTFELRDN